MPDASHFINDSVSDRSFSGKARINTGLHIELLLKACSVIGDKIKVKIEYSDKDYLESCVKEPVHEIARTCNVRIRKVALRGKWWSKDGSPMLAYYENSGDPVALINYSPDGYTLVDPSDDSRTKVDSKLAGKLDFFAYEFYSPFPDELSSLKQLFVFGINSIWKSDLAIIIGAGIASGVLGMAFPAITGLVFARAIPQGDLGMLVQISLILLSSAVITLLLQILRGMATLRIEGKLDASVQSAIWDRLLRLPAEFFRNFTVGDLTDRTNCVTTLRKAVFGIVINTIITSIFSLFNLILLFYYSPLMAFATLILAAVSFCFAVFVSNKQLEARSTEVELEGDIYGFALELIKGIAKFRTSGTEERALGLWAKQFINLRYMSFKSIEISELISVYNSVFPIAFSMLLYYLMYNYEAQHLSTASFIAFITAATTFLYSVLSICQLYMTIVNLKPVAQRAEPILKSVPEVGKAKKSPSKLSGSIKVQNINFRYAEDQEYILKNISIDIEPGKMAAIVGPSGSGKSTLLRLLLGFEKVDEGSIHYDNYDINDIDTQAMRRQFGVVMQNSSVMTGDIYSNIAGNSNLTVDEAWEIARMVGLDKDIGDMPMGMHTVVGEGGGTLSGGQRQRLIIARAIAHKPGIIFMDEATSALDNNTQKIVMESLGQFEMTRLVVAHRLSTIVNADMIYVIDKGYIVQSGRYNELMEQEGLFLELAKRQIV